MVAVLSRGRGWVKRIKAFVLLLYYFTATPLTCHDILSIHYQVNMSRCSVVIFMLLGLPSTMAARQAFTHQPKFEETCVDDYSGHLLDDPILRDLELCTYHCLRRTDCWTVEYNIDAQICFLYSATCTWRHTYPGFAMVTYSNTVEELRELFAQEPELN